MFFFKTKQVPEVLVLDPDVTESPVSRNWLEEWNDESDDDDWDDDDDDD